MEEPENATEKHEAEVSRQVGDFVGWYVLSAEGTPSAYPYAYEPEKTLDFAEKLREEFFAAPNA